MTILATHVAIVLGAWRLRIRIDIDEPRAADLEGALSGAAGRNEAPGPAPRDEPRFAARGRG